MPSKIALPIMTACAPASLSAAMSAVDLAPPLAKILAPSCRWQTCRIVLTSGYSGSNARLKIYDISGRLVRMIRLPAQDRRSVLAIPWEGTDDCGRNLSAGTYFIQIQAGQSVVTRKAVLIR